MIKGGHLSNLATTPWLSSVDVKRLKPHDPYEAYSKPYRYREIQFTTILSTPHGSGLVTLDLDQGEA